MQYRVTSNIYFDMQVQPFNSIQFSRKLSACELRHQTNFEVSAVSLQCSSTGLHPVRNEPDTFVRKLEATSFCHLVPVGKRWWALHPCPRPYCQRESSKELGKRLSWDSKWISTRYMIHMICTYSRAATIRYITKEQQNSVQRAGCEVRKHLHLHKTNLGERKDLSRSITSNYKYCNGQALGNRSDRRNAHLRQLDEQREDWNDYESKPNVCEFLPSLWASHTLIFCCTRPSRPEVGRLKVPWFRRLLKQKARILLVVSERIVALAMCHGFSYLTHEPVAIQVEIRHAETSLWKFFASRFRILWLLAALD